MSQLLPDLTKLSCLRPRERPAVASAEQKVTRNGVTVHVEIYGDSDGRWILEVVDAENTSHVWDDPFDTDQEALAEALRALDEETLEFWGAAADRPMS